MNVSMDVLLRERLWSDPAIRHQQEQAQPVIAYRVAKSIGSIDNTVPDSAPASWVSDVCLVLLDRLMLIILHCSHPIVFVGCEARLCQLPLKL